MVAGITYSTAGRLLDLEILQTPSSDGSTTPMEQMLASPTARAVTGVHAATQRLVLLLLTRLGDVAFAPDMGTRLLHTVGTSSRTLGQVERATAFALGAALLQLRAANVADGGTPAPDEDITSARVTGVDSPQPGRLRATVELKTAAGDTLVLHMPVPVI